MNELKKLMYNTRKIRKKHHTNANENNWWTI